MQFKIFTFQFKKILFLFILCFFTLSLLLFSRGNLLAAKSGLQLWANAVVPTLLPFFIATELLRQTQIVELLENLLAPIMRPLFRVPGIGAFPFLMGIISGYPMGAKIVANFKEEKLITHIEAERLLAFTNNSGPLFIIGTVGISLFSDTKTGFLLLFTHIFACITVGFLFRFWKHNLSGTVSKSLKPPSQSSDLTIANLGEVLGNSIMHSISTIVMIGGFVMLFSVITSILEQSYILATCKSILVPFFQVFHLNTNLIDGLLTGILELTNGVSKLANVPNKAISTNIILCSFLLGFGGISVLLQVLSITSKANISIKPYFIGKLLQGIIAAIYTCIAIKLFPTFNLDLLPSFANYQQQLHPTINNWTLLWLAIIFMIAIRWNHRRNRKTS